ncbi:hypothetical protein GCM10010989_29050 [Croceicoccus pelagius]|uniref:Uncharacterized protein n=2 Tax=Croceicoccus pelagius TaxID=1703341 RepID=A0A916YNE9_9SPHN|nr:hypothetical protein GCM10010989_29050 [Croceicoccus pelagius]
MRRSGMNSERLHLAIWQAAIALAIYGLSIIVGIVAALAFESSPLLLVITIATAIACWIALAFNWRGMSRTQTLWFARYLCVFVVGLIGLDVLIAIASYE